MTYVASNNGITVAWVDPAPSPVPTGAVDMGAEYPTSAQLSAVFAGYAAAVQAQVEAQLVAEAANAVATMLDTLARAWGYTDITSAATYTNSTVAQFKAEAAALTGWRDAVWAAVGAIQGEPVASQPTSIAGLLALLPVAPNKPVA